METDHKPLLAVFGSKSLNRLQQLTLTQIGYDFDI